MPKAGSGFKRAAGSAARSIFGSSGSRDWMLGDVEAGVARVQKLYSDAYRSVNDVYAYDRRGRISDTLKGFDRFAERAEALAKELAKDVVLVDRQAESEYRELRRWAGKIRASAQERKEFERTFFGEKQLAGRGGKYSGDASETAREMAHRGLIPHEVAAMGNNVDIMNAINNAVNAAKQRILTPVTTYGKGASGDFESDIFMGLLERYAGVDKGAAKRRK